MVAGKKSLKLLNNLFVYMHVLITSVLDIFHHVTDIRILEYIL